MRFGIQMLEHVAFVQQESTLPWLGIAIGIVITVLWENIAWFLEQQVQMCVLIVLLLVHILFLVLPLALDVHQAHTPLA